MRPRFSLRLILVAFALSAFALYFFVVRPTALAERFVAAVEREDFATANSLLREGDWRIWSSGGKLTDSVGPIDRVYVEILPRQWSDWRAGRRRLILRTARHTDDDGRHVEWTEDDEIVARYTGLELASPQTNW